MAVNGDQRLEEARANGEEVMLLDLDECSLAGQDMGDIVTVIQTLYRQVPAGGGAAPCRTPSKEEALQETVQLLVNPALRPTYAAWTEALGYAPTVVLYTKKSAVVRMARELGVPAPGPELVLGGGLASDGPRYLVRQLPEASLAACEDAPMYYDAFERLGLTAHAISAELGLAYTPAIIVTVRPKSTAIAGQCLGGYPPDLLHLYDDRAAEHAQGSRVELSASHMIQVPPFGMNGLYANRAKKIRKLIEKFPIPESAVTSTALREFTRPATPGEACAVRWDPKGKRVCWTKVGGPGVPEPENPAAWPLPADLRSGTKKRVREDT